MNNQTVVVEILPQSGKLCKSKLCGQKKRLPIESLDQENKNIDV